MPYLACFHLIKETVHWPELVKIPHNLLDKLRPVGCISNLEFCEILLQYLNILRGDTEAKGCGIAGMNWRMGGWSSQRVREMVILHAIGYRDWLYKKMSEEGIVM